MRTEQVEREDERGESKNTTFLRMQRVRRDQMAHLSADLHALCPYRLAHELRNELLKSSEQA